MTAPSASPQIRRLRLGDRELARQLFALMADVFEEDRQPLTDVYIDGLLGRESFWAIAALSAGQAVGGLTAHTLPMTRVESSEVFIYDVAVRVDYQRLGIGRQLVSALRAAATDAGLGDVFVPVDSADEHALDFYRALGGAGAPVTIFTFSVDQR